MEENKEILELLQKIEASNRRQERAGKVMCALALVAAVCCVVELVMVCSVRPQVNEILPRVDGVMSQMQTVLGNLEQTTEQLAALDLESMITDVDTLVVTGQESLERTMEKLEAIDFEALNQAIGDLAAVIEPLARLSNMFG